MIRGNSEFTLSPKLFFHKNSTTKRASRYRMTDIIKAIKLSIDAVSEYQEGCTAGNRDVAHWATGEGFSQRMAERGGFRNGHFRSATTGPELICTFCGMSSLA